VLLLLCTCQSRLGQRIILVGQCPRGVGVSRALGGESARHPVAESMKVCLQDMPVQQANLPESPFRLVYVCSLVSLRHCAAQFWPRPQLAAVVTKQRDSARIASHTPEDQLWQPAVNLETSLPPKKAVSSTGHTSVCRTSVQIHLSYMPRHHKQTA